jgi:hypothetical protein
LVWIQYQIVSVHLKRSVQPENWKLNLAHDEAKKNCTDLKTNIKLMSVFSQLKLWEKSRCITYQGKEGTMKIYTSLFSLITRIKTNMLLIIFLVLIVNLASFSGECEDGTLKLNVFYWIKLGISVITRYL